MTDISQSGFGFWLDSQLHPDEAADTQCQQRLDALKPRIKYGESKDWPAMDEARPLRWLNAPIEQAWPLADNRNPMAGQERARPRLEVILATLTRAAYSRWQLREMLVDFWHNHFNVNAWDQTIGVALPSYDREVIRRHCLGNFREMLEAVAKSAAMLCYLNNRSSRSGAPNENYARELFELHSLGRDAYLNRLYNRWREVPGANQGRPSGFIDQDVYEAARAFTGWGLADGSATGNGQALPRSGRFAYVEGWHDNYQKRVLATEFDPYQPAQADGLKVLDLAAFHPATARHLALKLCRRLLVDQPPESLIASTARIWLEARDKPDQIARTVRHIVLSPEFATNAGGKVKRPLELVASFVRLSCLDFTPTEGLMGELDAAGQRLFGWPTPTGHPDLAEAWLGPNTLRRRWTLMAGLSENWWGSGLLNPFDRLSRETKADVFIRHWLERLLGVATPNAVAALLSAAKLQPDSRLANDGQARRLVAWCAMAPEFQLRG